MYSAAAPKPEDVKLSEELERERAKEHELNKTLILIRKLYVSDTSGVDDILTHLEMISENDIYRFLLTEADWSFKNFDKLIEAVKKKFKDNPDFSLRVENLNGARKNNYLPQYNEMYKQLNNLQRLFNAQDIKDAKLKDSELKDVNILVTRYINSIYQRSRPSMQDNIVLLKILYKYLKDLLTKQSDFKVYVESKKREEEFGSVLSNMGALVEPKPKFNESVNSKLLESANLLFEKLRKSSLDDQSKKIITELCGKYDKIKEAKNESLIQLIDLLNKLPIDSFQPSSVLGKLKDPTPALRNELFEFNLRLISEGYIGLNNLFKRTSEKIYDYMKKVADFYVNLNANKYNYVTFFKRQLKLSKMYAELYANIDNFEPHDQRILRQCHEKYKTECLSVLLGVHKDQESLMSILDTHAVLYDEEKKSIYYVKNEKIAVGGTAAVHTVSTFDTRTKILKEIPDFVLKNFNKGVKPDQEQKVLSVLYTTGVEKFGESYLIMPFIQGNDLVETSKNEKNEDVLIFNDKNLPSTFEQRLDLVIQLIKIVKTLHDKNWVHNDLSLRNIKINYANDKYELSVLDFGCSQEVIANELVRATGDAVHHTIFYTPPEMNGCGGKDAKVGKGSDIYSLSLIIAYLLDGRETMFHSAVKDKEIIVSKSGGDPSPTLKLAEEKTEYDFNNIFEGIPELSDYKESVLRCLNKMKLSDYDSRPSIDEIYRELLNLQVRVSPEHSSLKSTSAIFSKIQSTGLRINTSLEQSTSSSILRASSSTVSPVPFSTSPSISSSVSSSTFSSASSTASFSTSPSPSSSSASLTSPSTASFSLSALSFLKHSPSNPASSDQDKKLAALSSKILDYVKKQTTKKPQNEKKLNFALTLQTLFTKFQSSVDSKDTKEIEKSRSIVFGYIIKNEKLLADSSLLADVQFILTINHSEKSKCESIYSDYQQKDSVSAKFLSFHSGDR